jgi:succinoglycan biosynthesis protein ExoM
MARGRKDASLIEVSVIIPTFRRADMLRAAVESVLAQRDVPGEAEIIVVDNDPGRSAEAFVTSRSRDSRWPLRYVGEARPGISHARNAGVAAGAGPFVAFLDDDEVANDGWLANMLGTAGSSGADVVVGPVRPCFPAGASVPGYARRIYHRDARLPTGQTVVWSGIGNSLLRRDTCLARPMPFDPKFGLSGGEDTVLMARLREEGRRIVWCAEAWVTEMIPADKLTAAYLLRRAFRTGQTTAFLPSALAHPRWSAVLRWMAIGGAEVVVYGAWSLMLRLSGREAWLTAMAKAASGLGKLLWHPALHIRNYQLGTRRGGAGAG